MFLSVITIAEMEAGILKLRRNRKTKRADQLASLVTSIVTEFGERVLEVDIKRHRISLTMRLDEVSKSRPTTPGAEIASSGSEKRLRRAETRADRSNPGPAGRDAMAEAFRRAGLMGKTPGRQ